METYFYRNSTIGRSWNNLTSDEQDKYLEDVLGNQQKYGANKVLVPTIFYSTVSILGIPGNILTLLTISKNSYMKTAPNHFIFNLAVADLITLILGNVIILSYYNVVFF